MKRRAFIQLAGGGTVVAASVVLGGCSAFEVPASAITAWRGPSGETEIRRWVLSYALLAPNPHNMQPWIADLRRDGEILLRLDPSRLLPATDPYGRQILMGAGAFLELLSMAAAERGHRAEVELFPDGEPGQRLAESAFARVRLIEHRDAVRDPLFARVLERRTDRQPYDRARPPSAEDVSILSAAVRSLPVRFGVTGAAGASANEAGTLAAIRTIARDAWRAELTTERTYMESLRLLRIGSDEIDRHRDGIAMTRPSVVMLAKLGLFDRSRYPAPDSTAVAGQIEAFDALTASTPAYLWIVTEGNRRAQQIDAGRAYVRVNLAGTSRSLSMHPNEQALQEYPEVVPSYRAIHRLLDAPSPQYTVQMLARVGRLLSGESPAGPAPRRGLVPLLEA